MPDTDVQVWNVDDATYYGDYSATSFSMLKVARESLPLYHRMFVARQFPPVQATLAMRVGSAVHCLCLEPHTFQDRFLVLNGLTKAGKRAIEAWKADPKNNPTPLSERAMLDATAMADAIKSHPLAARLLAAPGFVERPVRWRDSKTGLWLKSKMDKVIAPGVLTANPLVVEIKTAIRPRPYSMFRGERVPGPFAYTVIQDDYHVQLGMYSEAVKLVFNAASVDWVWVVVGKGRGHEVWTVDGSAFAETGYGEWRKSLDELAAAHQSGRWELPDQHTFFPMEVPKKALLENAYNQISEDETDVEPFQEFAEFVA